MDLTAIGKKIQQERKAAGYTQKTLADAVGITQSMISLIEKGETNFNLDILVKICNVLEICVRVESGRVEFYRK